MIILDNPIDSKEISESIQMLNNQVKLCNKISENGFKKSQAINWENTTNMTLNTYKKIL